MKDINLFLIERLKLNKDTKLTKNFNENYFFILINPKNKKSYYIPDKALDAMWKLQKNDPSLWANQSNNGINGLGVVVDIKKLNDALSSSAMEYELKHGIIQCYYIPNKYKTDEDVKNFLRDWQYFKITYEDLIEIKKGDI